LLKGIFRTKNLDDILAAVGEQTHALKRTLGPLNVTLLGIGAIIGAVFSRRLELRPLEMRIGLAPDPR